MKCYNLAISGKTTFDLIAGIPVWTEAERPSIIVGRTYEIGNVFQTETRVRGLLVPMTDALIQEPGATNVNRLISAAFKVDGDGFVDLEVHGDKSSALVSLCAHGYREMSIRESDGCTVHKETDATLHGAYFTDRGHGYLLSIATGGRMVVDYGVAKHVKTRIVGERWWQWSYWFECYDSTWITEFHSFEISFDGEDLKIAPVSD